MKIEVICWQCGHHYHAPETNEPKNLECPHCGVIGKTYKTGQVIPDGDQA